MFRPTALVLLALVAAPAQADEGMWTLNGFPAAQVKARYGFEPSQAWLDEVRLASARLAGGCSASFVSPGGLVMTNHHCAAGCIEQLSSARRDLLAAGFYARTAAQELQCPAMELNQLLDITDVTEALAAAGQGLGGHAYTDALNAEMSRIEKACAAGADDLRCDVVTLYQGGRYHLYRYRRFQDVRLVFAPENAAAMFGGDPDNFTFPRYNLDATFLRAYVDGKPAKTEHYFRWSARGAQDGELTFISGHPGRTSRGFTEAQLEVQRDVVLPEAIAHYAELRGLLTEFQNRGPEQRRTAAALLLRAENYLKVYTGQHQALADKAFFASKVAADQALRARVDADPALRSRYGQAWDEMARAQERLRGLRDEFVYLESSTGRLPQARVESGAGFFSQHFLLARALVRAAEELRRPNEQRLREYVDSNLPAVRALVLSPAPIHQELEVLKLTWSLTRLRAELGPDHPTVKQVLGKESPQTLARRVIRGTRLGDVRVRRALLEGGRAAVEASTDPMVRLARQVEADARAIRKRYEDEVESVVRQAGSLIARARFDIHGEQLYPDATFSLRLSYGAVQGYLEDGKRIPPMTTLAGAFERHTGEDPYALPATWLRARGRLDLGTPYNVVTTNDIIGGNSGSPVFNREREVVGLVFDGNIHSLGGDFGYDGSMNRAIAVHSAAILETLDKVYGARRVLEELRAGRSPAASPASAPVR